MLYDTPTGSTCRAPHRLRGLSLIYSYQKIALSLVGIKNILA